MTGLFLVPATPPAPVQRQPVDFIAQVVACRCMPRQELVVVAREGLALVMERPLEPLPLGCLRRRRSTRLHTSMIAIADLRTGPVPSALAHAIVAVESDMIV